MSVPIVPVVTMTAALAVAYATLVALRRRRAHKQAEDFSTLAREGAEIGPEPQRFPPPLTTPTCPSCHAQLKKTPKRKTKCHSCGQAIYVRSGQLLSLEQLVDWDEQQAEGLTPNPESKLLAAMPIVTHTQFLQLPPQERWRYFWVPRLDNEKWIAKAKQYTQWLDMGGSFLDSLARFLLSTKQYTEEEANHLARFLLHYAFRVRSELEHRELLDNKDVFPYWQYMAMSDGFVRNTHAALNGLVLPADDPFWKDHYPPWEWGCRCSVIGVTTEEYKDIRKKGRIAGNSRFHGTEEEKVEGWTLPPKSIAALHQGVLIDGAGNKIPVVPSPLSMDAIFGG